MIDRYISYYVKDKLHGELISYQKEGALGYIKIIYKFNIDSYIIIIHESVIYSYIKNIRTEKLKFLYDKL